MEKTLKFINELIKEGIILKYAIGGGIASLYYLEPTVTYDLDVMVILSSDNDTLMPLKEIYEWARKNGFPEKEEHIFIDSIPVQFLPVYNDLVREAVENSRRVTFYNTETFIISPEYLIAIMLQTGRGKDKGRALQFYEEVQIDKNLLNEILEKYSLKSKLELLLQ